MKNALLVMNEIQKMKQVILGISAIIFYLTAPLASASAQTKENEIAYVSNSFVQQYRLPDEKNFTEAYLDDISIKVKRNFTKSFENITNEKWYKIKDGYFASFNKNDIKTEVYYSNRGTRLYNLLTYHEDQLASRVKDLVKEKYKDYTILTAFEYQFFDGPVYIIKMKNTNTYKTVVVCDNELQVIEKFTNRQF
jgi:hypothetical protein